LIGDKDPKKFLGKVFDILFDWGWLYIISILPCRHERRRAKTRKIFRGCLRLRFRVQAWQRVGFGAGEPPPASIIRIYSIHSIHPLSAYPLIHIQFIRHPRMKRVINGWNGWNVLHLISFVYRWNKFQKFGQLHFYVQHQRVGYHIRFL